MLRDRRGVGVAEYALLLFLVVALAAVVFRYMGKNVKHAGNKTEEQFQTNNASGANSAGGAASGGAGGTSTAGGGAGGGGGKTGSGGGGSGTAGGGGGGGGQAQSTTNSGGGAAGDEEPEQSTPLWKIIGGVFLVLFAIGGYFAFRKQSKSG